MSALLPLAGFWAWGQAEKAFFQRALAAYRPLYWTGNQDMNTYQVSVLVCTVNTLLARSLRSWLDNDPREVIIVTIPEHEDHIRSVVDNADLDAYDFPKVKIVTSPIKGKRAQMVEGIKHVQGSFIANVDDHITWHDAFLREMRACWDEPSLEQNLGAVAATIEGIIPEDRCDEKVISPYEVAAMRVCWDRNPKHVVAWSAARWSWGLCGASYLVRADIFKDHKFIEAFLSDDWQGKKLDVGEDTFVARWLQSHNYLIAYQNTFETTVHRTVKTTSDFFAQMFRWERSTIQLHIRQARMPQTYQSLWVARKTWGRLLRPVFTTFHILAWIIAFSHHPFLALLFVAWYIVEAYPSYKAFFDKYPYMRHYWWAAVAQDYFYIVQDYYCWATLKNTRWESRSVSTEDQNRLK